MNPHRHAPRSPGRRPIPRQRGAVLVVSLLLLLVMTLLGLGASQSTRLQERMAGNQRDQELALQAAEAAMRYAESKVSAEQVTVNRCEGAGGAACDTYDLRKLVDAETKRALDLAAQTDAWWAEWGRTLGSDPDDGDIEFEIEGVSTPPELVVEHHADVPDVLSYGDSSFDVVREFYTVTARSTGQTDSAKVVIQSTYARIAFQ